MTLKDNNIFHCRCCESCNRMEKLKVKKLKEKIKNSVAEGSLAMEVFNLNVFPLIDEVFGE